MHNSIVFFDMPHKVSFVFKLFGAVPIGTEMGWKSTVSDTMSFQRALKRECLVTVHTLKFFLLMYIFMSSKRGWIVECLVTDVTIQNIVALLMMNAQLMDTVAKFFAHFATKSPGFFATF